MLPRQGRCVLSRLRCNKHNLLLSFYLSRIGRIENSFCSVCGRPYQDTVISLCTVQLRTLCVARFLAIFCLSTTSVPGPGKFCFILFVLFAIFIIHSRESELYRYTLDGKSALAWELLFSRFMGHLFST